MVVVTFNVIFGNESLKSKCCKVKVNVSKFVKLLITVFTVLTSFSFTRHFIPFT